MERALISRSSMSNHLVVGLLASSTREKSTIARGSLKLLAGCVKAKTLIDAHGRRASSPEQSLTAHQDLPIPTCQTNASPIPSEKRPALNSNVWSLSLDLAVELTLMSAMESFCCSPAQAVVKEGSLLLTS